MRPADPMAGRSRAAKYLRDARSFPGDAANAWRREGLRGIGTELAYRSLYRIVRWSRSFVIAQDVASSRDVPPPRGIDISRFAGPDWDLLHPIASDRERHAFEDISARGRTCLVAWRGERPVGYTWCSERIELEVESYPLPLPPDAVYLWGLYVPSAERSGGIGTALASARLRWARERGYRRAWRVIATRNVPSFRTVTKTAGLRS
jgi:GNAT superfamily N-acetyltransferase